MNRQLSCALMLTFFAQQSMSVKALAETTTQPTPYIEFVTPHANDKIKDYPIFVETRVTGFTLASPVQYWDRVSPEIKFIGHIHYTLDDSPIFATKSTHVVLGKPSNKSLPAGTHMLRAELVNINHNSLIPPVFAEIPLICEPDAQKQEQPTGAAIAIDKNGRRELEKVEQRLQETQKQLTDIKARLKDTQ